ncbi:DUF4192 domain-containing protein [Actinacidiphila acidipaludis]|uniref:DUF4192 domain-containing protein n=1 Tax=Actinacidiphila acidipaludis TaxID=2873382 RepID=A0ABS7Q6S3_9ACTN|nr:DUF4192 domain-containing protein [Streptomyces acidipaludis]MBY8878658.1 DUF4192 domain-containing protein [Streptomyces acidipaludis]
MTQSNRIHHGKSPDASEEVKVTLRGPDELADALPYLMGFHPNDSIVLVALHGEHGRFGGRVRLGLPHDPGEWPEVAAHLAGCLVRNSAQRGAPPDAVVAFVCEDPDDGEGAPEVMERLRPLVQHLRLACGALEVPVVEALCVSAGRWWSYVRPESAPSPKEGDALPPPGSTTMAATAAYLGLPSPSSLRDIESRLKPREPRDREHEIALDTASAELVPRMLADGDTSEDIRNRTITLARGAMAKLRKAPVINDPARADRRDDRLLADDEAAMIILGLQDRDTRDRAAEWMEPAQADAALRLWRALARRCAGTYAEHAAAPLTLAGWVAWSSGDEAEARAALGLALDLEPTYTFARLLHHAVNAGMDPELLRSSLRRERRRRVIAASRARRGPAGSAGRAPGRHSSGGRRARTRR